MLQLKNITKIYKTGNFEQKALDQINLTFRPNEFVSILGQSGSGKTTMLNIIGGLDQYTSGDLLINGRSTKDFKDRDWDSYRNNSVGFVFQSYNLIPHQTALSNVEMALTLSGVSKDERRQRATQALERVGLKDHIHKRPNQMSGGQMQRIAIARALVNDPDILLADEPTGALDSETSVQIMDLLKEIAKDRLVVMVTHNPELAEQYSTRIVRVSDGHIIDDSDPYHSEETIGQFNPKKTKMSFWTALSLSLNNLMTKKGRTILTAFAGSIGIIGITLIMSLSNGVQQYIDQVQEDTLTSYPLSIYDTSSDFGAILESMNIDSEPVEEGYIESNQMLSRMMQANVSENDLTAFKHYIESNPALFKDLTNSIEYTYPLNLALYDANTDEDIVRVNPNPFEAQQQTMQNGLNGANASANAMFSRNIWSQLLDNKSVLDYQYEVLSGKMPEKAEEVILIVDENHRMTDLQLYSLGFKTQKDFDEMMASIGQVSNSDTESQETIETLSFSYEELVGKQFKLVLHGDHFQKEGEIWVDKSDDPNFMKQKIDEGLTIEIVGIVKPNPDAQSVGSTGAIGYTKALTDYVIKHAKETDIAKAQLENSDINVLTNAAFPEDNQENEFAVENLSEKQQAELAQMSPEDLNSFINTYTQNMNASYDQNLLTFGVVDEEVPSSIRFYAKSFEGKDEIKSIIDNYNDDMDNKNEPDKVLRYTDEVGIIMSSVTSIVNMISYVLIAFVAISLIVSSIMIGIITYISVLERTKEIGILRAMGASKKDISRVFNAETLIEGFAAGALGIIVTLVLNIGINLIVENLTGVAGITSLPIQVAVTLIIISMVLTLIAGIIPARFAAKKDPVEALRSE